MDWYNKKEDHGYTNKYITVQFIFLVSGTKDLPSRVFRKSSHKLVQANVRNGIKEFTRSESSYGSRTASSFGVDFSSQTSMEPLFPKITGILSAVGMHIKSHTQYIKAINSITIVSWKKIRVVNNDKISGKVEWIYQPLYFISTLQKETRNISKY